MNTGERRTIRDRRETRFSVLEDWLVEKDEERFLDASYEKDGRGRQTPREIFVS